MKEQNNADESTSTKILEVAVKLFAEKGFDSVSIRDIASEADVSFSLVRHHHGKKEQLILRCHRYVLAKLDELYGDMGSSLIGESGESVLDQAISSHQFMLGSRSILLVYLTKMFTENDELAREAFDEYFSILSKYVDRIDDARLIDPALNKMWLVFIVMFNQLGPAFLSTQINRLIDSDVYDSDVIKDRNNTLLQTFKKGIFLD